MGISECDLSVFDALSIVNIDGFKTTSRDHGDQPGEANWLLEQYGMCGSDLDAADRGIIWADYDMSGFEFRVLIASDEVEDLSKIATEAGYTILAVTPVTEPMHFGDGGGIVTILKHPDGWVLAS